MAQCSYPDSKLVAALCLLCMHDIIPLDLSADYGKGIATGLSLAHRLLARALSEVAHSHCVLHTTLSLSMSGVHIFYKRKTCAAPGAATQKWVT